MGQNKRLRPGRITVLLLLFSAASPTRAQFLDFSQPARAAGLGGNLVALPEGSSALAFNPAGLALQERYEATARYESMFSGLEDDNISNSNIGILTAADSFGALGAAWDHLGSNLIQQDRLSLDWGRLFPGGGPVEKLAVGFSLSYLTQRYVLSQPLAGVSTDQLSSSAFGFGAGVWLKLPANLSLGLSADDLNQPNLGVVGTDRLPTLVRWGLAMQVLDQGPIRLTATAAQWLSDTDLETQGGMECVFPDYGVRLRAGLGTYEGTVGAGIEGSDFFLDYAYLFSISSASQLSGAGLPGSHLLEAGMKWGSDAAETAYDEKLRRAQEAEASGQWDQALWCYQEILSTKPGDSAALAGRQKALDHFNRQRAAKYYQDGSTREQKGSLWEARDDFEMASRLDPGNTQYSGALDRVNTESTQKEKAASLSLPPTAQVLTTQADLYLSKGRPDLAQKDLEAALKTQPQNSLLREKLAVLKRSSSVPNDQAELAGHLYDQGLQKYLEGDLEGAIRCWQKAVKTDPGNMKAQNNLVHAQLEKEAEKP